MPEEFEAVHLLFVESPEGLWMTSPQVPDLAYTSPSPGIDWDDVRAALAFADAPDAPLVAHRVLERVAPDGTEYTIRMAVDEHVEERSRTGWLIEASVNDPAQRGLSRHPVGVVPEVQFVCAMPADRIGWVIDQLAEGDVIALAVPVAGTMAWVQAIGRGVDEADSTTWAPLDLGRGATVAELMSRQASDRVSTPQPLLV